MLELYVWGQGLNSPSLDPECIAAIALFTRKMQSSEFPEWKICIGQDPCVSPNGDFPAVFDHQSAKWVGGFGAIARYLRNRYSIDVDRHEAADSVLDLSILTSHIQGKGRELCDLYTYVSYDNYYNATSTAWTNALPWYANYIIPPSKRRAAQARTSHLGITSLNMENVHDLPLAGRSGVQNSAVSSTASAMIAEKDRQNRRALLDKSTHSDTFRLRRLADAFFSQLRDSLRLLHGASLVVGSNLVSVDYLALGYLSLISNAQVPNRWLANVLRDDYPELSAYSDAVAETCFAFATPSDTVPPAQQQLSVGNAKTQNVQAFGATAMIGQAMLASMPVIGPLLSRTYIETQNSVAKKKSGSSETAALEQKKVLRTAAVLGIGAVAATVTAFTFWLTRSLEAKSPSTTAFTDLGEAGGFFSALGSQMAFESGLEREQERLGSAIISAVEID